MKINDVIKALEQKRENYGNCEVEVRNCDGDFYPVRYSGLKFKDEETEEVDLNSVTLF